MLAKYSEKVICLHCNKEYTRKTLDKHNTSKHEGKTVSKDISSMFSSSTQSFSGHASLQSNLAACSTHISADESKHIQPECEEHELSSKVARIESLEEEMLHQFSNKISTLSSQVNTLISIVNKQAKSKLDLGGSSGKVMSSDKMRIVISHARNLDTIIKWLEDWMLVVDGLICIACSKIFNYNYTTDGTEFGNDSNLPMSFKNLKTSILRHTDSVSHQNNHANFKNLKMEERAAMETAKQCGINCAAAAYTIYFSESYTSYEHHITDIYNCGGIIGSKNHSRMFPYKFLPHIYNVIRTSIKNFIVTNKLPFGILADKMTSKHLTRHMVGIRIPIWDIRSSFLVRDLYIQCSPIKDVTGLGVTEHVIETLESFGLDRSYQRDNLSGCAMDGQYIHLNFSGHLK